MWNPKYFHEMTKNIVYITRLMSPNQSGWMFVKPAQASMLLTIPSGASSR